MASWRFPFAESIDFKEVPGGLQYHLTFWRDLGQSLNLIVDVIVNDFEPTTGKVRTLVSLTATLNHL